MAHCTLNRTTFTAAVCGGLLLLTSCGSNPTAAEPKATQPVAITHEFQSQFELAWMGGYTETQLSNAHATLVAECMQAKGWDFEPYLIGEDGDALHEVHPMLRLQGSLSKQDFDRAYIDHEGGASLEGTPATDGCVGTASSTLDRAVPAFGSVTAEQSALAKERQSALAGPNARLVACMARSGISEFVPPETLDAKSASFAAALEVQGLSMSQVAPLYEACADLTVRRSAQEIDARFVVDLLATLEPSDRKDVAMRLAS